MLHDKFQDHRPIGSGEEILKGFYHIWALLPSWSCDLDHLYKLLLPFSKEAPHDLALICHAVSEKRCLTIMVIYMYIDPWHGQTTPWVLFINIIVQSV